jgi:ribosomal protein S18 acetylase RimI-like enzyme
MTKKHDTEPSLRDFREEDYLKLMTLWELTSLSNRARGDTLETIRETLQHSGRLLVMEHNNIIIGSSWITNDGRRLYLHHFGIHPDYRGRGYAHALTRASLAIAKELNMQIKLEVHRTNQAAIALYRKHHFGYLGDYDVYIIREPEKIL